MSEIEHVYQRIRERRAEIERIRLALDQEDSELAVTERNVARFLPNSPETQASPMPISTFVDRVMASVTPTPKRGERKPKGIPTIVRMACDVLRESTVSGEAWLDTHQITEGIRRRWWPEAEAGFIQPQLWRAATKRKVLLKDGARYALPHKNERSPAMEPAGLSQTKGAEASAWSATSVPAGGIEGTASISLATHQPPT